jgi:hypothetical protein
VSLKDGREAIFQVSVHPMSWCSNVLASRSSMYWTSRLTRISILRIDCTPESTSPYSIASPSQAFISTQCPISITTVYSLPNQVLCPSTIRLIMYIDPANPPKRITKYGVRSILLLGVWHQTLSLAVYSSYLLLFQSRRIRWKEFGRTEGRSAPGSIDAQSVVHLLGTAFGSEERGFLG